MKNKNQENLQSRREFFKNAAKVALPVIGAVALASLPIIKTEAATGCSSTSCTGGCIGSCKGSCSGWCKGQCKENCYVSCEGGSKNW